MHKKYARLNCVGKRCASWLGRGSGVEEGQTIIFLSERPIFVDTRLLEPDFKLIN